MTCTIQRRPNGTKNQERWKSKKRKRSIKDFIRWPELNNAQYIVKLSTDPLRIIKVGFDDKLYEEPHKRAEIWRVHQGSGNRGKERLGDIQCKEIWTISSQERKLQLAPLISSFLFASFGQLLWALMLFWEANLYIVGLFIWQLWRFTNLVIYTYLQHSSIFIITVSRFFINEFPI